MWVQIMFFTLVVIVGFGIIIDVLQDIRAELIKIKKQGENI